MNEMGFGEKIAWLCVLLCMCGSGCAQTLPRVSGNLGYSTLSVTYRNLSEPSDSMVTETIACAPDKSFSFDLPDPKSAYMVEITYPEDGGRKKVLRLLSVPGEQAEVTGWTDIDSRGWVGYRHLAGSDFYRRWGEMRKELEPYYWKTMKLHLRSMSAARDPKQHKDLKSIKDSAVLTISEMHEKAEAYMKARPGDPVSVLALDYLPGDRKEEAFKLLDRSVREGVLAPYAIEQIERYRKQVKQETSVREQREKAEAPQREKAEKLYASASKKRLEAGDQMPDIPFTTLDGKEVYLSSLKGKYVYIDIWATWCGPCVALMPKVKKLEEAVKGRDIVFVKVSLDENRRQWEKFVREKGGDDISWYAGGSRKVLEDFLNISGIPRIVLLDKEGRIVNAKLDYPGNPGSEEELKRLLDM